MYIFLSLLGSSIDGLICGVLMSSIGIKCKKIDFLKIFTIIFSCCLAASFLGKVLSYTSLENYVNYIGILLMFCLSYSAFKGRKTFDEDEKSSTTNIYMIAFSVAADACIVCVYLGMSGTNIFVISLVSAILHCLLIYSGQILCNLLLTTKLQQHSKLASAFIFLLIGLYKLKLIL